MICPRCSERLVWISEDNLEDVNEQIAESANGGSGVAGIYNCENNLCGVQEVIIYTYHKKEEDE